MDSSGGAGSTPGPESRTQIDIPSVTELPALLRAAAVSAFGIFERGTGSLYLGSFYVPTESRYIAESPLDPLRYTNVVTDAWFLRARFEVTVGMASRRGVPVSEEVHIHAVSEDEMPRSAGSALRSGGLSIRRTVNPDGTRSEWGAYSVNRTLDDLNPTGWLDAQVPLATDDGSS